MSGHIDHAIRFTAQTTDTKLPVARPPSGRRDQQRQLPADGRPLPPERQLQPSGLKCARPCQVVIQAMKTYGLILADNGATGTSGDHRPRWTYKMVDQLKQIPASAFQAVDESCLMVSPNSAQANQPGTAAYQHACG